ncbi:E3 ubiquitin-protein ligase RMA1 [Morus notabilis]|uniref:E3 ubiquitin-protein ligase RMA n=1 Tax=Morus notabilis TaxID=981085 RepID=W9RPI5_9ROSA|nr:uncharacterized protein LOC21409591 [Morus notabilis]EXB63617.1 E3 ubiquitin-protein ligase RMA1 [Morus notabilis]
MDTKQIGVCLVSKSNCPIDTSCDNNMSTSNDFDCCICYQVPVDPVVTLCGHLFCWPCLYKWLNNFSQSKQCPVCKCRAEENNLVPLFGKGRSKSSLSSLSSDSSSNIPDRPIATKIIAHSQTSTTTTAATHDQNHNLGSNRVMTRSSTQINTRRLVQVHALNGIVLAGLVAFIIFYFLNSVTTLSSVESAIVGAQMFGAGYAMGGVVAFVLVVFSDIQMRRLLSYVFYVVFVDILGFDGPHMDIITHDDN